jgi:exopolysaccharide biosynthesis WecB/TagA/CpsF family protein
MINAGKHNVLGILMDAVDYEAAVEFVLRAAHQKRGAAVSALAVHGLMTGVLDREQKYRLNHFDLLVPDGQPVRWAMNLLYSTHLRDRVYGPNLTKAVCARAAEEGVPVFFYGSTPKILAGLRNHLECQFPGLIVAGMEPSKFRQLARDEKDDLAKRIQHSGARLVFVGIGCPRQEIWAYEFRGLLSLPVLGVGAAFPILAGAVPQAPLWMQDRGLEWLFRLWAEPRRLWRRYMLLNPAYVFLVALQALHLSRFVPGGSPPSSELLYG